MFIKINLNFYFYINFNFYITYLLKLIGNYNLKGGEVP